MDGDVKGESAINIPDSAVSALTSPDAWSGPAPLLAETLVSPVPTTAGLYRILQVGAEVPVIYIGQTGRSLRERLRQMLGAYNEEMPYRDPHTVAPALWALRVSEQAEFHAQWHGLDTDPRVRLGLEALAISLERRDRGSSPRFCFGGMPTGFRISSGNNSKLAAAGKRFRGGPDAAALPTAPSIAPTGDLSSDPMSREWMNLPWSTWVPFADVSSTPSRGIYRLRGNNDGALTYIGIGKVKERLTAHGKKSQRGNDGLKSLFGAVREASWCDLSDLPHRQLLEIENDLIASHVVTVGAIPLAQFMGKGH